MPVDAFALIALLRDEPAAGEVEGLLRRGEAAVTAINLAEALDVLERVDGVPRARLDELTARSSSARTCAWWASTNSPRSSMPVFATADRRLHSLVPIGGGVPVARYAWVFCTALSASAAVGS